MGPCVQDEPKEVTFCGTGNGAAFVIPETISPSKRLALAWRSPNSPPTVEPGEDEVDLLLVRLADGAILSRSKTEYWNTGEMHANRRYEKAFWAPNSRFLVRAYDSRFSTDIVELYGISTDDHVWSPFDLLKLVDAAARTKLKTRVKNADDYSFSLTSMKDGETAVAIDDQGNIRAEVMFWVPKNGPFYYYTVKARAKRGATPDARVESVVYRGMEKGENN